MPLHILEYGPTRAIGIAMRAQPGNSDFAGLWQKTFGPRMPEIDHPPNCEMFGVCRCLPGVTDAPPGTFEYLALMQATPHAPVPPGLVALNLPRAHYAAFEVPDYSQFHAIWQLARRTVAAQSEWKPYCIPSQTCQCATHPAFEYYPPDSYKTGKAMVYIPVRRG